jgi:hypothetical protein
MWLSKKEGIPCNHMVAISKLGRINGLSRIVIMPHWHMTEQWHNQFLEDTFINAHKTLKPIKANLTPQDDIHYCRTWVASEKKGHLKKETRRKSIADHTEQSAKKKCRTAKASKTPEKKRVILECKDVKDGQEGKA